MKKVLVSSLILLLLNSCSFLEREHGPFHHEAELHMPVKYVEYNNDIYCQIDMNVYKMENNTFNEFFFESKEEVIFDFEIYEDKYYVATPEGLKVYNNELSLEKVITELEVHTLLIDNDIIYYNVLKALEPLFYSYNINTDEKELIIESFTNAFYYDCARPIYSNYQGILFYIDELNGANIAKGASRSNVFGFLHNEKVGTVELNEEKVVLYYDEKTYEIEGYKAAYFYNDIYIDENKLVFSVYEYVNHDDCNYYKCICRNENAKIIEFNFNTLNYTVTKQLPINSYLIDISNDKILYYNDGKVYENDSVIHEVSKVEPKGQYIQKGSSISLKGKTKWLDAFISYYQDQLYFKTIDHSDSISDEY